MVDGKAVHDPPGLAARAAFDKIKEFLCGDLVLARPDFSQPSGWVLLSSIAWEASWRRGSMAWNALPAIGVWSTRWIECTSNWAPVEHKCFALCKACECYYDYLSSNHVDAYTDSEPLQWLNEGLQEGL